MITEIQSNKKKQLLEVVSEQAGYFTAKQALKRGYSYRLQHYHKSQGQWQEVDRGVFRLADYPNSPHEDLIRWSLWSRNRQDISQAVVSHESALSVHDLSDVMPTRIHLTVPPTFRKMSPGGCILHRSILKLEEIEKHGGLFVTNPLRTILDVAEGNLSLDHLEKAVRDAIGRGFVMPDHIKNASMSRNAKEKMRIVLENVRKFPF